MFAVIYRHWLYLIMVDESPAAGNQGKPSETGEDADPQAVCESLLGSTYSLQLATIGEDNVPHCGYTPFIVERTNDQPPRFYVFVSELAVHTRDLLRASPASIMIIEDEQKSVQVFARTRVSYQCKVSIIKPDAADYTRLLDSYQQRHGNIVSVLRGLPDFHLICLTPTKGQFVMGFGKAFALTGPCIDQFEHSRRA